MAQKNRQVPRCGKKESKWCMASEETEMATSKTWKRNWVLPCGRPLEECSELSHSRCYEHLSCASVLVRTTKMLTTCHADGTVANTCILGVSLALSSVNYGLCQFQRVYTSEFSQSHLLLTSFVSLCAVVLALQHHDPHPNPILRSSELVTPSGH